MRLNVSIEKQKDGTYIAYNTNDESVTLIGTGISVGEAKEDFLRSMKEVSEACEESGLDVSESLKEEPVFQFDVSSLFEYYNMINVSAFARYIGMNDALMRQYKRGDTYISENQLRKIEEGIHALGKEFSSLRLV